MLGQPYIELAIGTPNGVETVFETSAPYMPGTVQVFVNGLLRRKDFADGWSEVGSQKVKLTEAPLTGDTIQIYYRLG
jgi:hypothetical protein